MKRKTSWISPHTAYFSVVTYIANTNVTSNNFITYNQYVVRKIKFLPCSVFKFQIPRKGNTNVW